MYGKDISKELAAKMASAISYDPISGKTTWAVNWSLKSRKGAPAGSVRTRDGYSRARIRFEGINYLLHRVIMAIRMGELPGNADIDHIDGNGANNALSNLRITNHSINMQNRHRANRNSTSGIMGVHKIKDGRYKAYISVGGKTKHIGIFPTESDAFSAYLETKRTLHAGCTI